VGHGRARSRGYRALFLADFTANQLAGVVVIFNDIDVTALLRITLNNRKLAVPEFLDFLGLAIEIVIVDLADQIPMRVHWDKIGLPVEIPIAFNLDHLAIFVGFDNIRPAISVCIDGNLVAVLVDPVYPLVRTSVATTMRDRTVGIAATGNAAAWRDKYKGKFDEGWDKAREDTLARQKALGIVPPNTQLTPKPTEKEMPDWDKLREKEKKVFTRHQEIFAAYAEETDHEIGRVVQAIDDMGVIADCLYNR
jgi:hypothetical protein